MRIGFFGVNEWEKSYLRKKFRGLKAEFFNDSLNKDNVALAKKFDIISIFIYTKLDKVLLKKLPNLKFVATRSTGFDHIDVRECARRKIAVCNVPFYGENTVAEHTFALILSLSRNIHKSYIRTLRNDFTIEGLKGFDLKGRILGVVGAGHIGLHVIRIAKGFGMEVFAYDVHKDKFLAEVLGFTYAPLEKVLENSDIITLHVPYMKATHHIINRESFKKIKRGAILINTSRGGLVDTDALIEALDKGIIGGAGLDVMEGEELIKEEKQLLYDQKKVEQLQSLVKDHILLSKDNVVFTPHIAFYSQEALERILETTSQNILAFMNGGLQNAV